jgi:protein xylosyltransferase
MWLAPEKRSIWLTMKKDPRMQHLQYKWMILISFSIMASVVLLMGAVVNLGPSSSASSSASLAMRSEATDGDIFSNSSLLPSDLPLPPRFAYLISGTKGDSDSMKRLLQAVYHPRNFYLLHLDLEAPIDERISLTRFVKQFSSFHKYADVQLVEKPNLVTYKGSTMIASTLHGASILLKHSDNWDWFINLSATDYPLVTQDGTLS